MKKILLFTTSIKAIFIAVVLLPVYLSAQDPSSIKEKYEAPGVAANKVQFNGDKTLITTNNSTSDQADLKFAVFPPTSKWPQREVFNVFPNPAVSEAQIVFQASENGMDYNVVMLSNNGKPVLAKKGSTVIGTNLVRLDINSYPMGIYYVQLTTKNGRQVMKLVKVVTR